MLDRLTFRESTPTRIVHCPPRWGGGPKGGPQRLQGGRPPDKIESVKNSYNYVSIDGLSFRNARIVATNALGKGLPFGAVIHHANEDKGDDTPSNLVICPDAAYHRLLHARTKAYNACGHASWIQCYFCGKWGSRDSGFRKQPPHKVKGVHEKCAEKVFERLLSKVYG